MAQAAKSAGRPEVEGTEDDSPIVMQGSGEDAGDSDPQREEYGVIMGGKLAAAQVRAGQEERRREELDAAIVEALAEELGGDEDGTEDAMREGIDLSSPVPDGDEDIDVADEAEDPEESLESVVSRISDLDRRKQLVIDAISMFPEQLCAPGFEAIDTLLVTAAKFDPLFANQMRLIAEGGDVDGGLLGTESPELTTDDGESANATTVAIDQLSSAASEMMPDGKGAPVAVTRGMSPSTSKPAAKRARRAKK